MADPHSLGVAADLSVIVVAALLVGVVCQKFRQPLILGYIAVGVILGPHTAGFTISDTAQIEFLAEIGVALLLFAIGLEFSFKDIRLVRGIAVAGTIIQMGLCIAYGALLGLAFGWPWEHSVWFGALISLSSTVIVLKTLMARGLMGTLSSRVMIGILLVQDLTVIPLMILLPQIKGGAFDIGEISWALARALVVLVVTVLVATRIIPRLMRLVVTWNSRELFLLSVTAIALGTGYALHALGLSFALGAFVAGMVVSDTDYSHHALSSIIPIRDLFSLLFFVSVGMLFEPSYLVEHWRAIFVIVATVMIGKAAIFMGIVRVFGYGNVMPLAVGLGLFQIGEFSFVLARLGLSSGSIDRDLYSLAMTSAIITMLFTPFGFHLVPKLYRIKQSWFPREPLQSINLPNEELHEHVIVAGAGRIGRYIADVLTHFELSFVVIELDHRAVEKARERSFPLIFGDATESSVLEAAGLGKARLLVLTVPNITETLSIVQFVRERRPDLHIVARAQGVDELRELHQQGVYEAVQPEFEAALELLRQALLHLKIDSNRVESFTSSARVGFYAPIVKEEEMPA